MPRNLHKSIYYPSYHQLRIKWGELKNFRGTWNSPLNCVVSRGHHELPWKIWSQLLVQKRKMLNKSSGQLFHIYQQTQILFSKPFRFTQNNIPERFIKIQIISQSSLYLKSDWDWEKVDTWSQIQDWPIFSWRQAHSSIGRLVTRTGRNGMAANTKLSITHSFLEL